MNARTDFQPDDLGYPSDLSGSRAAAFDEPGAHVRWVDTSLGSINLPSTVSDSGTAPPTSLTGSTVLMIDDEPLMTDVVQAYLEDAGYRRFVAVNDPRQALEAMRNERPGVVLLDLMMPGMSGFELLERIRAEDLLRFIPVIVLTAASNAETKLRALELGATEFLAKPVDASELILRVRNSLAFKSYQDRLASNDALTGLPNRRAFMDHLQRALRPRATREPPRVAVLHIGLDRFRQVNDSLGYAAGDRLLAAVAERLRVCVRRTELVNAGRPERLNLARLEGDEFGLLLPRLDTPGAADRTARRVLAAMSKPFQIGDDMLYMTPSIGIAVSPDDGRDDETLVRNATAATAHAKGSGRNTFNFYSRSLGSASVERLNLETQLYRAVDLEQFRLHYQPKVELSSGRVIGAEALLRWEHPTMGLVPPDRFVPVAEECGLIVGIGQWVLEKACAQAAAWARGGLGELTMAVNVSRHEMVAGGLAQRVARALARHGLPPRRLVIEITESMMVDRVEDATRELEQLRTLGVALSVDDFGTGYSSMNYLKRFRVQELKIDRSFVQGTPEDSTDSAIVRALVVLAKSLRLDVIAEGVETEPQRAYLESIGCDAYQGYLCSRPLPAAEFERRVLELRAAGAASVGHLPDHAD